MKIEFIKKAYVLHIEQNIMEPMDYYYQYNESKQIAMDAIRNKLHVVLLGGDATGKTQCSLIFRLNRHLAISLASYCE